MQLKPAVRHTDCIQTRMQTNKKTSKWTDTQKHMDEDIGSRGRDKASVSPIHILKVSKDSQHYSGIHFQAADAFVKSNIQVWRAAHYKHTVHAR